MSLLTFFRHHRGRLLESLLIPLRLIVIATMVLTTTGSPVSAVGGDTISTGSHNFLSTELFFEPEVPFVSLKKTPPTWNEMEQILDNPYQVVTGTVCNDVRGAIPGNDSGYRTYCTGGSFIRRPTFGVTLPRMLVHPLNYQPATGGEMRLINPHYAGGNFMVSGGLGLLQRGICYTNAAICNPTLRIINVSSGASRTVPGETEIDYADGVGRRLTFCLANPEPVPLAIPFDPSTTMQDFNVCGAEPGEPGALPHLDMNMEDNLGLPLLPLSNNSYYSTAAVPAPNVITALCMQQPSGPPTAACPLGTGANVNITGSAFRLTDPDPTRGVIQALNPVTGVGVSGGATLHKPSLRVAEAGGTGLNPNYLINTDPNNTTPSTENDYVGLFPSTGITTANYAARKQAARLEAMVLGKSLFWDMQVGSDAVQACGSCHAHAGADNRTKNQVNPNDIGGDLGFDIAPNTDLNVGDFPLHKLNDPEVAGDPRCTPPIVADVAGISFPDGTPPDHPLANPNPVVCDAGNIISDTNDVASSQGVHFGRFFDIPPIGSFGTPSAVGGVVSVLPDLRSPVAADNVDPIPGFQGASPEGTVAELRRVEPRNTPTIFLADVNFDNFWDGRARHDDNGGSVFGPSDPQAHVFVDQGSGLTATRQIIKFSSLASLAKGPALSQFEMSFNGRNWAKIAKKLLQNGVTPLANQLVDPTDSILGRYSNQNGSACAGLPDADRSPAGGPPTTLGTGVPGLCISYPALIRHAFYPALWQNTSQHLDGCYTDGRPDIHPNQCADVGVPVAIPVLDGSGNVVDSSADPFDRYVLSLAGGPAAATDTNQFTQMESNFSLFWGQSIHLWATILVPDDTPWDQFLDQNPDAFYSTGETGEPLLVLDLPSCNNVPAGYVRDGLHGSCFQEVGNFKRDPGLTACVNEDVIAGVRTCTQTVSAGGTRLADQPDPLLGLDIFFGSNVSLKNPNFRSARCGECHAPPTLTDHTMPFTVKATLGDLAPEFERGNPIIEPLLEPLGRPRIISGFLLESEINGPGQDAIERRVINQSIAPAPVSPNVNCTVNTCSGYAFPDGITSNYPDPGYTIHTDIGPTHPGPLVGDSTAVPFTSFGGAFFDNGMYNLGVRPCVADQAAVTGACEDNGRGNTDAFGWPLSFAALLMKNLGGPTQQPGVPLDTFDPSVAPTRADEPACAPFCATGGLFELTAHDQRINPGYDDDAAEPLLPPYLAPFASNITVGDAHPQMDEACGPLGGCPNTIMDVATTEGLPEIPFNPRNNMSEVLNSAYAPGDGTLNGPGVAEQGTWPFVNRVGRFGSFKAPQLREVALTGPYFHNGGKLTLRQVVDFYVRGGDFPVTNSAHRDFNMLNLNAELQSNLSEAEKVALVDFLLELTDNRVAFDKAPFDHPEMIIPLDGTAPENTFGHDGFLAGGCVPNPLSPGGQACNGGMFLDIPAAGAGGNLIALPNFLGVTNDRGVDGTTGFNCDPNAGPISHYCH